MLSTFADFIVSSFLPFSKKFAASIVGFVFRNESLESCIFSYARELNIEDECNADMLTWFLPLLHFLISTAKSLSVAFIPLPIFLPGLGFIFHILTSMVLRWGSVAHLDLSSIYSFNPLVIFSAVVSPVPSLLHLLLVVMNYSALMGWSILMYNCIALLIIGHFPFVCIVPAYILLARGKARGRQNKTASSKATVTSLFSTSKNKPPYIAEILTLFSLCFGGFLLMLASSDYMDMDMEDLNASNCLQKCVALATKLCTSQYRKIFNGSNPNYEPAANFTWYLDVQVFRRFSDYFLRLESCQVFLFFVPLLFRMSRKKPLHTVRSQNKASTHPHCPP